MHKLLERVEKELENIAEKGITSSNLETAYKLIDIYKDIKESKYYEQETKNSAEYGARARDSRGRFMEGNYEMNYGRGYNDGGYNARDGYNAGYNARGGYNGGEWQSTGRFDGPMLDERTERHMSRIREGMEKYNAGRNSYRGGDSQERMIDGIEMTMSAICMFVESLCDFAETPKEKEIIRKHLEKMKNI